jgi:hypothetical protein
MSLYYQAQAAAYAGQLRQSRILTRRAVEAAGHADHTDSTAFYLAEGAVREALFGNATAAKQQAGEALKLSLSREPR